MSAIKETQWIISETDANLKLMSEVLKISEITACVMAHRGIRTKNIALSFLAPSIDRLRDPMQLKDMSKALQRISAAIESNEKIMIYGDYDVDGIMSTVILYKALRRLNADCEYYIPHRIEEGYGLNIAAVEKLAKKGAKLLITVDNGISAITEVAAAVELGMDTIIIDHHEPVETLPPAVAIVDPKQADCEYPFKEMCAAGLVFKLSMALCEYVNTPLTTHERDELLSLAAIATLCDIVNLSDENRILVNSGLAVLNANKLINAGLGSLITMRGYLEKTIDTFTVGFVLGPCLNATGRLGSAELAVDLLLASAEDTPKRMNLAQELTELNESRKSLTSECVERALATLPEESPKVLVLTDPEAHESVAGIVAGRIREATFRPTILLTKGDGAMKGSGRSIEGYNLFEALYAQRHLFTRFGGHAMAAGLTLPEENINPLREALNKDCTLTENDFRPKIQIDRELTPEDVTLALADELSRLAPFGKGNSEPLFAIYNIYAEKIRVMDEKNTLIFTFATKKGRRLKGIAFGLNEAFAKATAAVKANKTGDIAMDVAFTIETNEWNKNVEVQLRIRDFRVLSRLT
ncbi:MAG: single-stranded-DNA-specific exonuclease RecJ [Defluviitaleaceae bacterium]|nr:single-stranded-DNA-specific exonuclease RecJ [Defluviitaleaceae bacterium]